MELTNCITMPAIIGIVMIIAWTVAIVKWLKGKEGYEMAKMREKEEAMESNTSL